MRAMSGTRMRGRNGAGRARRFVRLRRWWAWMSGCRNGISLFVRGRGRSGERWRSIDSTSDLPCLADGLMVLCVFIRAVRTKIVDK